MVQDDSNDVLERVFNEVKDRKEGVLFTCIKIMAPENANEIVNHFSISRYASFDDDLQVLSESSSFQPILTKVEPMNIRNMPLIEWMKKPINWNSSFSVGLIIVSALVIISLWNLLRRDDMKFGGLIANGVKKIGGKISRNQHAGRTEANDSMTPQYVERQADLCLVIPCKRVELFLQKYLRSSKSLSSDHAVALVNESVYFLATESAENDISKINLSDGWEDFPEGSDLLVYLHIPHGNDLIEVELKRSLSRAMSAKEEITIQEIGLLNDLNNLEKFHRA